MAQDVEKLASRAEANVFIASRLRTNNPTMDYPSVGEDKSRPSESFCAIPSAPPLCG